MIKSLLMALGCVVIAAAIEIPIAANYLAGQSSFVLANAVCFALVALVVSLVGLKVYWVPLALYAQAFGMLGVYEFVAGHAVLTDTEIASIATFSFLWIAEYGWYFLGGLVLGYSMRHLGSRRRADRP
jgi:hypothetical protein